MVYEGNTLVQKTCYTKMANPERYLFRAVKTKNIS